MKRNISAVRKVVDRLYNITDKSRNQEMVSITIPGFEQSLSGGFRKGSMYLFAGKGLVGKSTLFVSLAANLAIRRGPQFNVGVISLDISPERWVERTICNTSDIELDKLSKGELTGKEIDLVTLKLYAEELEKINLNATCSLDIVEIKKLISSWVEEKKVQIVFIDSIDFIRCVNLSTLSSQVSSLKEVAASFNIPILISLRLGDRVGPDKENISDLSDLRKSGALEENCDVITIIHRPEYFQKVLGETQFKIVKNNFGVLSSFTLCANLNKQGFEEIKDV